MQSFFLSYKSSLIHYQRAGDGGRLIIGLHGYGESGDAFDFLEADLPSDFSLIAIDLPFHGKTSWNEGLNFTPADLITIINRIVEPIFSHEPKIYLMGFSLGARIALGVITQMHNRIEKIILLAPDGLHSNGWYWFATQTWLGNHLFSFTMHHPGWLFGFINICNKTKLIGPSTQKFTMYYIQTDQVRNELYQRWTSMRNFKNDPGRIKSLIFKTKIPVRLIYGEFDRIIPVESGKKFREGIENYCDLKILDCGHQVLNKKNLEPILLSLTE
ncbi:MAG TPA: alpha/beta hydrolase [Puia sp.]|nr:alpha/beta hydrolase [Puia sp.]